MQTKDQIKADAINDFVSSLISARVTGWITVSTITLAELHRVAQNHVEDNYGVELPTLINQWGKSVAEICGFKVADVGNE